MAKFTVSSGVAMPEKWESLRKYPWSEMKVGDSFARHVGMWGALRASAHKASKSLGYKFSIRRMGRLVRIWRTG